MTGSMTANVTPSFDASSVPVFAPVTCIVLVRT